MGLDAWVYCDCVEKGRLRVPHALPHLLVIDEVGCPQVSTPFGSPEDEAHYRWTRENPCGHEDFVLLHRRLGNAAFVGWVRGNLERIAKAPERRYPIIWTKVVYSGTHASDHLDLADVAWLREELAEVRREDWTGAGFQRMDTSLRGRLRRGLSLGQAFRVRPSTSAERDEDVAAMMAFFGALDDLVAASLEMRKPIVF